MAYPDLANPHDSLGEAYFRSGELEKALNSYRRSAELDPGNQTAVDMIEQIGNRLQG